MLATDLVASADERKKKSVYYESCTSDWKNDFPTLVACLKSDKGMPHTRQEAGFLLWHHALEGDDVAGLLSAGLMGACLANLDAGDVPPTEKACSAGILLALVAGRDEVAEQLLRSRAPSGRPSLEVLHSHLADDTATAARHHCCRLLHLIAKQVGAAMLRCMDHQLPYLPRYLAAWGDRDATVVTGVACMVALLVQERPELAAPVVAAGGLEALLGVLRSHKAEVACCAAATCLARLLAVEGAAEQLIAAGGIPVLIDLIGAPPHLAANLANLTLEDLGTAVRQPRPPSPSSLHILELSVEASTLSTYDGAAASMTAAGRGGGGGSGGGGDGDGSSAPTSQRASGGGDAAERSQGSKRASTSSGSEAAAAEAADGAGADRVRPPGAGSGRSVSYSQEVSRGSGGGSSQASSPRKLAGGGSGTGPSASPSLTSLGASSMTVRVQLPLVIPGIHSPSAAAAAAALSGMPSPHQTTRGTATGLGGEASALSFRRSAAAASASLASVSYNGAAALPPPVLPAADLGTNRCGLRWIMLPGLEAASLAAACLTLMVNRPEVLAEAERRLAAHRIVAQLKAVMPTKAGAEGLGKKAGSSGAKKKKGLGLTPEQTAGLVRLMALGDSFVKYCTALIPLKTPVPAPGRDTVSPGRDTVLRGLEIRYRGLETR